MKGIRTAEKLIFLCCYTSTVDLFFFFFFLRRGNLHGHQATSGGEWRGSAGLQPTKTSTMTTRLRSKEAREPVRATQRAPHAHKMHRLRGRRTRQSDSPTGLPGGPEELIYQHLTLTPTGLERRPWSALSKRARDVCRAPAGRSSRGGSSAPSLFPLPPSEA